MKVELFEKRESYEIPRRDPSFGDLSKFKSTMEFPVKKRPEFGYQISNQLPPRFFNRERDSAQFAAISRASVKEIMER